MVTLHPLTLPHLVSVIMYFNLLVLYFCCGGTWKCKERSADTAPDLFGENTAVYFSNSMFVLCKEEAGFWKMGPLAY